ncbi:MarR family transcriptional regulator [Halodesulfurarchaeum sp. HSR-GB]|uniref:helix-turn-helix transcriptional regulator n=1 Tax=Halodesulfurarchaeum sp. HSR-GB TaxID=3074077 RepID=UPI002855084B|nr:MarR family transcriptional regulator [Halodesulfurarchaeum sp. HSR-GB]MDR5657685.1 MarR family transcriptional regulator [Halodesulfurarchaeum sp. HSR-GB]
MVSGFQAELFEGDLSKSEEEALQLIQDNDGIHQSELWKELDTSSRTGSRIAKSLADSGIVNRKETTHNGRKTYELVIPEQDNSSSVEFNESELPPELQEASPLATSIVSLLQKRGEVPITRVDREIDRPPQAVDEAMGELIERDIVSIERKTLYGREQDIVSYLGL